MMTTLVIATIPTHVDDLSDWDLCLAVSTVQPSDVPWNDDLFIKGLERFPVPDYFYSVFENNNGEPSKVSSIVPKPMLYLTFQGR